MVGSRDVEVGRGAREVLTEGVVFDLCVEGRPAVADDKPVDGAAGRVGYEIVTEGDKFDAVPETAIGPTTRDPPALAPPAMVNDDISIGAPEMGGTLEAGLEVANPPPKLPPIAGVLTVVGTVLGRLAASSIKLIGAVRRSIFALLGARPSAVGSLPKALDVVAAGVSEQARVV